MMTTGQMLAEMVVVYNRNMQECNFLEAQAQLKHISDMALSLRDSMEGLPNVSRN